MIFLISLQCVWATSDAPNGSQLEARLFSKKGESRLVEGNRAVEQSFVKLLLTDPGTNQQFPGSGSGLVKIAGQKVTPDTEQARITEIAQAIIAAEEQLVQSQVGLSLTPAERLATVDIDFIRYDGDTWSIQVRLNMEDGNALRVLLGS